MWAMRVTIVSDLCTLDLEGGCNSSHREKNPPGNPVRGGMCLIGIMTALAYQAGSALGRSSRMMV